MARGITTTNTTPIPITTETVVPETTNGGVIPGVTPNSKDSLVTQTNTTPTLANNTVIPELTTSVNTSGLTTTEDVTAITATTGKFARGLDKLKLKNPIAKQPQKVLEDISVTTDTFNSIVAYVRDITDATFFTDNYINFLANKKIQDQTITSDTLISQIGYGRELAEVINFADLGIKYNLSANYNDTLTITELLDIALQYIKDISGAETTNIVDLKISNTVGTFQADNTTKTDILTKLFSAEISPDFVYTNDTDYAYSLLRFLEDYLQVATKTPITPYKLFTEVLTVQETSERVWSIFREFFDLVISTDDYYGTANIDDDQYANINKTIIDVLNFGEAIEAVILFALYIIQQDYYSATDTAKILTNKVLDSAISFAGNQLIEITTGKTLQELNSFNETKKFYSSLVKNEPISITEEFTKALSNKALFDFTRPVDIIEFNPQILILNVSGISDILIPEMTYRRIFEDIGTFNDSTYNLNVAKYSINTLAIQSETSVVKTNIFIDASTVGDTFTRQVDYRRVFSDLVDITDDYYGAATVGDDEYVSFNKLVVDYLITQETLTRYFTTIKSDNIVNSSTNAISILGYYTDLKNTFDLKTIEYFKYIQELSTTSNLLIFNTSRVSEELLQVLDPYFSVATFNRSFIEQITYTSNPSISISIPETDNVLQTDNFSRLVNYIRNVTENKATSEVFINTARLLKIEPLTIQDMLERSFIRQTSDSQVHQSDRFTKLVNYIREFSELIISTDDYYGVANIDDDQIATIKKRLIDISNVDDLAINFLKSLYINATDSAIITSPISLNLNKPITDDIKFSDLIYSNSLKIVLELLSLSQYQQITTTKVLADSMSATDPYFSIANFNRAFTESINSTEYITNIDNSIIKSDTIINQDYYYSVANFYRQINEYKTLTEQQKFNIQLYNEELLGILDTKSLRIRSYPDNDLFTQTDDSYTITNFVRNFQDFVDATDDYYGAATVGDDEYAQVNKSFADNVSLAEAVDLTPITFTLYNPQEEFYTSSDEPVLFISKYANYELSQINNSFEEKTIELDKYTTDILYNYNLASMFINKIQDTDTVTTINDDIVFTNNIYLDFEEFVSSYDYEFNFEIRPVIVDTSGIEDYYSYMMTYRRTLLEIMALNSSSDRRYVDFNKYLDNTNNIAYLNTDNIRFTPNKGVQEQKFIFDFLQTQLSASYGIYDTVTATDDYYGASNIDDDQYAQFNKTLADSYRVLDYPIYAVSIQKTDTFTKTEQTTLNIGKNTTELLHIAETFTYNKFAVTLFTDQILKSDSGTINNQNYFASTYVEPGYAGTNRTIGS